MEEKEQATVARPPSPWMTTDEAAGYLSVAPGTLRNWRVDGQGPRANVVGRIVRYHRDNLDAFMQEGAA
ncbi:helix-turn-helix domain-containing protein [Albidovulum sp.]|uniref:helix-turn-helix domain-containing protein n=1 Tax=Albidovulum sp. TaxID=1872424 RepID=UPI0039B8518F